MPAESTPGVLAQYGLCSGRAHQGWGQHRPVIPGFLLEDKQPVSGTPGHSSASLRRGFPHGHFLPAEWTGAAVSVSKRRGPVPHSAFSLYSALEPQPRALCAGRLVLDHTRGPVSAVRHLMGRAAWEALGGLEFSHCAR